MTTPTVTVVLPTRNRRALLEEAVGSVERQTLQHWELVVVDDASEDGTWDWLLSSAGPRIRVLRQEEQAERSAARNRGLAQAHCEFVIFLDDDDRLLPTALERLTRQLMGEPAAVAAVGARVVFDARGHRKKAPHPPVPLLRHVWADVMFGWVACPSQSLFRARALAEAGGWDERLVVAEDQDLWLRLARLGPVAFAPRAVLENRRHDGQWRPPDVESIERDIRVRSLSTLTSHEDRQRAQRAFEARILANEAKEFYRSRDFRAARALYTATVRIAPWVLWSPLVGPALLRHGLKSVAGLPLGADRFNRLAEARRAVRQLLERDPWEEAT